VTNDKADQKYRVCHYHIGFQEEKFTFDKQFQQKRKGQELGF
jgi:hypothetical protein